MEGRSQFLGLIVDAGAVNIDILDKVFSLIDNGCNVGTSNDSSLNILDFRANVAVVNREADSGGIAGAINFLNLGEHSLLDGGSLGCGEQGSEHEGGSFHIL